MQSRWGAIGATLIALACAVPPAAQAGRAVRLSAGFAPGAQLGASSAMHAELHIDSWRLPSQLTGARVLYPKGLGLVTSGLGLANCTLAPSLFDDVIVRFSRLARCPPNAVLGYGTIHAEVRLLSGRVVPESAILTAFAGPFKDGALGLVVIVDGQHPFGAKLALTGEVRGASGAFGGAIAVSLPEIPSIADLATVALTDLHLSIGSRRIVYYRHRHGKRIAYHPDGVGVPASCPAHGFRFRVQLDFLDGTHAHADTTVPCPPAA